MASSREYVELLASKLKKDTNKVLIPKAVN